MPRTFSISGQHYLFDVQTFAHVVLAQGGDEYHYGLYDRSTEGVFTDVRDRVSDLGVIMQTTENKEQLDAIIDEHGLVFTEITRSKPRVALPASHPMVNAEELSPEDMADYPYVFFDQGEDAPRYMFEEALSFIPRAKTIACTDRASLSELIVALNGYTITSGILVGISDGSLLKTVPLKTDVELILGYVTRKGSQLSEMEQMFIEKLPINLKRYVAHL